LIPTHLLIALALTTNPRHESEVPAIVAVPVAKKLVAEGGARLVDVRTPEEYAQKHIDGAINIPIDELEFRFDELLPKNLPLVVYCASGVRAAYAAKLLKAAGFTDVYNLGAMSRWNEKKAPKPGRELVRTGNQ
jgi:phage shock protein E